jgi:hypothetical protein
LSGLTTPVDIKQDPNTLVYYVNQYNTGAIAKYSSSGTLISSNWATVGALSTGLIIDLSSNVYVWYIGWLAKVVPGTPPTVNTQWCGPPGHATPGGGAIDSAGNLYIGFGQKPFYIYKCSTTVLNSFTSFATLPSYSYDGLIFNSAGLLFATSSYTGVDSISSTGSITTGIYPALQAVGITFDLNQKMYLSDSVTGSVYQILLQCTPPTVLPTNANGFGNCNTIKAYGATCSIVWYA